AAHDHADALASRLRGDPGDRRALPVRLPGRAYRGGRGEGGPDPLDRAGDPPGREPLRRAERGDPHRAEARGGALTPPHPVDIVAVVVVLALTLWGLLRGIARLLLHAAGLALGWYLAVRYAEPLATRLGAWTSAGAEFRRLAAFAIIFIAVGAAASVIG